MAPQPDVSGLVQAMPLFDAYVMVDWSSRNARGGGKRDCIWIAHGAASDDKPKTMSPYSRTEAEQAIRSIIEPIVSKKGRTLVCADFPYGFPRGFTSLLHEAQWNMPPWCRVWQFLKRNVRDDIGTKFGRKPSNRSNRFEVASAINTNSEGTSAGPFWCLYRAGSYNSVPQTQPPQPIILPGGQIIEPLRITDTRASGDTPFRIFGNGSVGSQIITGIPRLASIRFDPELADFSAVWPFETGWAPLTGRWLRSNLWILHAEIYPSVRKALHDSIKDRGQVRAMWCWARNLDQNDQLFREFSKPPCIKRSSREDKVIRNEEGWILGCPLDR